MYKNTCLVNANCQNKLEPRYDYQTATASEILIYSQNLYSFDLSKPISKIQHHIW